MSKMRGLLASLCLASMAACTPHDVANRYGADPVPTKAEFEAAAQRQSEVIEALTVATYPEKVGNGERPHWMPTTPAEWYEVTLTGYNVVDQGCDDYLRTIFKLDREKERFSAAMVFADKATGAILTASKVPGATVQIVSQAFGLGTNFGGAIADSYLYKLKPSAVAGAVQALRSTYRDSVAKGMREAKPGTLPLIHSAPTAFSSVREYRTLCFPESIEAKIDDMLSKAKGEVGAGSGGGGSGNGSRAKGTGTAAATSPTPQVFLRSPQTQ